MKKKTIKLWSRYIFYVLISLIASGLTKVDVNYLLLNLILFELLEWKCNHE